jgi:hypothetical protein
LEAKILSKEASILVPEIQEDIPILGEPKKGEGREELEEEGRGAS